MARLLAIDPGMNTGVALFDGGELHSLGTMRPLALYRYLDLILPGVDVCVIEDARLQSNIFQPNAKSANKTKAMTVARCVGSIDAWCSLVQAFCEEYQVEFIGISPKAKGKKLGKAEFFQMTGWEGRSTEHSRDAATVGWGYRNIAIISPRKKVGYA